jgi:GR25 family glycosyltransferase involved in LPS biosynthesis
MDDKLKILNEVFEYIFVITTPKFSDRINNMKSRLAGVKYVFFDGVYGGEIDVEKYRRLGSKLTRGQLACAASHIKLYEKIVNEKLNNVLVLEDDCIFTENIVNLKKCYSQLPKNYSFFHLGYSECYGKKKYSENLFVVDHGNISQTHAIHLNVDGASRIIDVNKNLTQTADGVFKVLLEKFNIGAYLADPMMALQDNNGENATLVQIDKKYGFGF